MAMNTLEINPDMAIGLYHAESPLGTLELDSSGTLWWTDAISAISIPLTLPTQNAPL